MNKKFPMFTEPEWIIKEDKKVKDAGMVSK